MGDYINRELLLNDLKTSIVVSGRNDVAPLELRGVHKVVNRIKAMPTEDVVPVVRCKNCKHYDGDFCNNNQWWNDDSYTAVNDNDYCSYGERKEENGKIY